MENGSVLTNTTLRHLSGLELDSEVYQWLIFTGPHASIGLLEIQV